MSGYLKKWLRAAGIRAAKTDLQYAYQHRRSAGTRRRERRIMNEEELLNLEGVSKETLENLKDNKGDD